MNMEKSLLFADLLAPSDVVSKVHGKYWPYAKDYMISDV